MTPSRPVRTEASNVLGCGTRWRGLERASWYSRWRSAAATFEVTQGIRWHEHESLQLLARGLSTRDISQELKISQTTVRKEWILFIGLFRSPGNDDHIHRAVAGM